MSFYNKRNGWVDTGKKITDRECPNCKSSRFVESVSREYCPDCGLECDYWGKGPNEVYENMMQRNSIIEESDREERFRRQMEEEWGTNILDWDDD